MGAVKAIGLMSGTSLDGVDVALIETDGERIAGFGPTGYRPYTDAEQALLRQALHEGAGLTDRTARPGVLAEAEAFVTRVHAETVEAFLADRAYRQSRRRRRRLPRPDRAAQAGGAADRADRRRRGAGAPAWTCRGSMISAPPMSPPAGRARRWCRCSIRRWRAISTGRIRSPCSMSAASPMSPLSTAAIRSPAIPARAMR